MTCAHCSLPLGRHVVDGRFCCGSCAAVHKMLAESGMADTFYRLAATDIRERVPASAGASAHVIQELESPVFLSDHTSLLDDGSRKTRLHLEGVHCAACVWLVERLPQVVPGVVEARLDLPKARLSLRWRPETVSLGRIARWLGRFGYTPHPVAAAQGQSAREERRLLTRVGMAWALAANVMLIAFAFYAGLEAEGGRLYEAGRWVSLGLTIPALFVAGGTFFDRAFRSLRRAIDLRSIRHLDMDTPVAIGLSVGFLDSTLATIRGSGDVWFDSLTVLVAALLTARWLQFRSRRMAAESADRLMGALPSMARLQTQDGEEPVAAERLVPRNRVVVGPGEVFPADGTIVDGHSTVDRTAITGESQPEAISMGHSVLAGTLNLSGTVSMEVERAGRRSRLGQLLEQTRTAPQESPVVQLADRLAGPFVATVLLLSTATAGIWLVLDPSSVVSIVVALLVITCPCALGMATPLAIAVASGRAAGRGIFVRNQGALDALSRTDLVVLDKTGTLTQGRPRLRAHVGDPSSIDAAAALEKDQQHPIADAVRAASSRTDLRATTVTVRPGLGVQGVVNDALVCIGKPGWADSWEDPRRLLRHGSKFAVQGLTPVVIGIDHEVVAVLGLGDALRPEAPGVVADLSDRKIDVVLVSGDDPTVAARVGREVGLEESAVFGGVSPEGKRTMIEDWQRAGRTVTMVGDGLNDAPALAFADVGITIDPGNQASRFASDIVVTRHGLDALRMLVDGASTTLRTIRRNLGISLGYNVLAAGLAITGVVTPLIAAIAMPISSLIVVGSSLSLSAFKGSVRPQILAFETDATKKAA